MSTMKKFICHSGGCPGSDMEWEIQGEQYGIVTIAYSFKGHKQEGKNPKILTGSELDDGFTHVLIANKVLKRYPQGQSTYVKSLLSRNWFQVKNAESVFAIGTFKNATIVNGGTGWAVQMAIDNGKFVYFFDKEREKWSWYHPADKVFIYTDKCPTLTENFAGIGTREINDSGKNAIRMVYEKTFKKS